MKQIVISMVFLTALLLSGCTTELLNDETTGNRAPVIVKALTDVSIIKNGTITISLSHLEAYDDDGDTMSLILFEGENYTLSGTTITPATDFIGDLYVKVQLTDGKLTSEVATLIISVVSNVELFPLLKDSWWEYNDYIPANDTILTSRLEVVSVDPVVIGAETVQMSTLTWSNLSEYGVNYFMYTSDTGTVLYGGKSATDEVVNPQLLYYYPAVVGKSWNYATLKYNATDGKFFTGETAQMSCLDSSIYVEVPAGIFECVELTLTYTIKASDLITSSGFIFSGAQNLPVVEKMYYSPGVGYVKSTAFVEGVVVWKKELTSYYVMQEI